MGSTLMASPKRVSEFGDKDKPKAIVLYEKVRTEIEELQNSVDTTPAEALLKKVKLAIDIKDYSSAEEYVRECIHKTHELKKIFEKAADALKTAWPRIKQARDEGVDVSRSNDLIKEARKALRAKQCQKSLELANLAVDLLLTPAERKKKRCDEIRERINTLMDGVKIFGEIKGVGLLLVHEAETLISKAEREYNAEEYDSAMQQYKKSEKSLDQLKEQYLYKQADNIYSNAESMINEMEKTGKTVPGTAMALLKAKDALDYEDYDDVIFNAVQIKNAIDKWEGERSDEDAIQAISKAQFILADLRKTDAETSELEAMFQEAKDTFEDKDFAKAEELALKVTKTAEDMKKEEHRKKAMNLLDSVRKEIAEVSGSVDTGRIDDQYTKANDAFESADYMRAIQILKRIGPQIQKSREKAILPILEKGLEDAKKAIDDGKASGVSTLEPDNWLRQARFAFENKKYDDVKVFIDKIMTHFQGEPAKKVEAPTQEYKRLIPEAMKAVQKVREQNWDVKPLVETLKKAPGLLKDKKYDELEAVTMEVKNEATRILTKECIAPAKKMLEKAKGAIDEAREKNLDISKAHKMLRDALKTFTEKKYYQVREKVEPIFTLLEEEEMKMSIHRAEIIIDLSGKIIKAYNKWGVSVDKHKELLEAGKKALARNDVAKAASAARQLDRGLKESRFQFLKKKCDGALGEARGFLSGPGAQKDTLGEAKGLLTKAEKMVKGNEIIKAWDTAIEAILKGGGAEGDYYKMKSEMVDTILLPKMIQLRNTDLDTKELETGFTGYESAFKKKNYKEAFDAISKVADDALSLEQMFIANRAASSVQDLVKGYRKAGVSTEDLDITFENVKMLMDEKNFQDALKLMGEVVDRAENMKGSIIHTYEPGEKICDTCSYPIIVFEPTTATDVICPVCEGMVELVSPPPPME